MTIRKRYQQMRWADTTGFSLIEAMVGIMIFTVGILAVTMMTARANLSYARSGQSTREVNATAISIEPLKHVEYANQQFLQDQDDRPTTAPPLSGPGSLSHIQYQVQDNAVVSGTKLIRMQNGRVNDNGPAFTLLFTKPEIR